MKKFNRIVQRSLPDGKVSKVYPFHVCTEGKENRVVCRDEEDLRVSHNFIPICARRANVIVFADCELNTHMHSGILAANYQDAVNFSYGYKLSYSKYFQNKYGKGTGIYNRTDSSPILLEDEYHVRNAICYIVKNSLDVGFPPDKYKWSSYSSIFSNGAHLVNCRKLSSISYREQRSLLKTGDNLSGCDWYVDEDGMILPSSYCDTEYSESAFSADPRYFLRVMGLTDDRRMEQLLVKDHLESKSIKELIDVAEERSRKQSYLLFYRGISRSIVEKPGPDER